MDENSNSAKSGGGYYQSLKVKYRVYICIQVFK